MRSTAWSAETCSSTCASRSNSFVAHMAGSLPDGCVVASLPNVRHHSVVSALLEGNWSYEPAGLLDETHLRFFTRRDMVDLFEQAGFQVAEVQIVPGPGYEEWRRSGRPGEVRVGRLHIADTPPRRLRSSSSISI